MDEPIELQDLVLNSSNKDAETAYEILDTSRDDVNDYMRIDKLAETITQPVNDRDNAAQRVDKADVSKQGTDAVAVRKLKIFCIILTTMVLISSGTTGALIHTLMMRIDAIEKKTATCGEGTQYRERRCGSLNPAFSGQWCSRKELQLQACNVKPCTAVNGGCSSWTSWSSCTSNRYCAQGLTSRHRNCTNPSPSTVGQFCLVNGNWTEWTMWSSCGASCGNGQKSRQRYCSNPRPTNGGLPCVGSSVQQTSCRVMGCPVNGGWSRWSNWTSCTSNRYCGQGLTSRHRTCTNPSPSTLGQFCFGDSLQQELCEVHTCVGVVIRLVNGTTSRSGRVEIYYDGVWGTICDDGWSSYYNYGNAKVVCRMLGYRNTCKCGSIEVSVEVDTRPMSGGTAHRNAHYGQGSGRITLDDVHCSGNETSITDCTHAPWLQHYCEHHEDVGVSCT